MSSYRQFVSMLQKRPDTLDRQSFEAWAASIIQAFDAVRVLCVVREGPWGVGALNRAIERELGRLGLIDLRSEWYEGRPVMVTRNQPQQRIFNGDIGIVLRGSADSSALRCHFLEGDQVHSVPVSRLTDVETAYAMTVHKSQGSEFGHVLMVMPDQDVPMLTRELVYTGITRARQAFTLVAPKPDLLATAIQRQTQRFSGLAALLAQRALHIDTL